MNEGKELVDEFSVIASTGYNDEFFTFTRDLSAIALANASATSQRADRLCFDRLEVINRKLFVRSFLFEITPTDPVVPLIAAVIVSPF